MEGHVETVVVDPDRGVDVHGQEGHLLAITRHQVESGLDVPLQSLEALVVTLPGAGLEDGDSTYVHVGVARLEVQERRVQ